MGRWLDSCYLAKLERKIGGIYAAVLSRSYQVNLWAFFTWPTQIKFLVSLSNCCASHWGTESYKGPWGTIGATCGITQPMLVTSSATKPSLLILYNCPNGIFSRFNKLTAASFLQLHWSQPSSLLIQTSDAQSSTPWAGWVGSDSGSDPTGSAHEVSPQTQSHTPGSNHAPAQPHILNEAAHHPDPTHLDLPL